MRFWYALAATGTREVSAIANHTVASLRFYADASPSCAHESRLACRAMLRRPINLWKHGSILRLLPGKLHDSCLDIRSRS